MANSFFATTNLTPVLNDIATVDAVVDAIRVTDLPDIKTDTANNYSLLWALRMTDVPAIKADIAALNNVSKFDIMNSRFIASEDLVHSNDAAHEHNDGAYTKYKEILCSLNGTYRIKFKLGTNIETRSAFGRIYKNGVAFGTARTDTTEAGTVYTEDLVFAEEDLLQLYTMSTLCNAKMQDFRIYGEATSSFKNEME